MRDDIAEGWAAPTITGRNDVDITRSGASHITREHGRILVTGATGFLGSHVVRELARTRHRIVCIVRATDRAEARERVAALHGADVEAFAGDLARPRLGIDDTEWQRLAGDIDTIIHCAAEVSLAKPYAELRGPNVVGTANLIELARSGRPKVLHHASTLSVFVGSDRQCDEAGVLREGDPLDSAKRLHGGYAQSKWAAEVLAHEAGANVYRFGLLTGNTQTGRAPERDWLTWFVRGLAQLGVYPRIEAGRVDLTPIDFAARAMVDVVLVGTRGTFHIANSVSATLDDIVAALRRAGVAMAEVSLDEFRDRVASRGDVDPLAALLGACRAGDGYARVRPCDLFQASGMTFDMVNTRAVVRDFPPPSATLLDQYVPRMLR